MKILTIAPTTGGVWWYRVRNVADAPWKPFTLWALLADHSVHPYDPVTNEVLENVTILPPWEYDLPPESDA